jgi:hypothetical protein
MKFKVLTSDWTGALALASAITPSAVDAKGTAGYLCVVRGEKCFLYSEDGRQRFRVPIPVFDVEGEGAFVFPTGAQGDLRYVEGWVEFESGEDGGANVVWCRRDTGGSKGGIHKIITFSPNALKSLDADFSKAEKTGSFPVAVLREALSMTRPYLSDPKEQGVKPECVNLQLFGSDLDADGNGFMLGCSMHRTSYFYSPELEGRSLSVYALRIPLLLSFLSRSTGMVEVHRTENSTYFMNSAEQVLGWSNQDFPPSKFGFYGLALDKHMLKISKASLEKELRYIRSTLPADKNKAFWSYDHKASTLTVSASNSLGSEVDSLPITVTPLTSGDDRCWGTGDLGKKSDVQCNVNLDLMIQLVEATKHPRDVVLGIAQTKNTKQHLFRVIEEYFIDGNGKYVEKPSEGQEGHQCRTVRFVPSKQ